MWNTSEVKCQTPPAEVRPTQPLAPGGIPTNVQGPPPPPPSTPEAPPPASVR